MRRRCLSPGCLGATDLVVQLEGREGGNPTTEAFLPFLYLHTPVIVSTPDCQLRHRNAA